MTDKHDKTPDLLLTTARVLRDHLGSIGKGKLSADLDAALKPHDEADQKKQEAADMKEAATQAKEDAAAQKQQERDDKRSGR